MAGETVQLRRPTDNYRVERVATDVVDMLLGNRGGMIRLRGYSGDVVTRSGGTAGTATSSNGFPLNIQSPIGNHIAVLHSGTSETAAPTPANSVLLVTDDGPRIGFGKSIRLYDAAGVDYAELTADADGGLVLGGSGTAAGAFTLPGGILFTGTGKRFLADFSNATAANRLLFQTSTVNGATVVGILPNGSSTTSGVVVYAGSNPAATAYGDILALSTEIRIESAHVGASYLPLSFYTSNTRRLRILTTGEMELGTTPAGAGYLRGPNNAGIYQRNAANSGDVHAIGVNSSDIIGVGQTGNTLNLLGTVVPPATDPPIVNGQVTTFSQAKAYTYYDVAGGGAVGGGGGAGYNYNIASVTKNAVGDFTVTIDRDFAGAAYVVVVTVQDNTQNLIARVNGQAAGSFDVHFRTTAAALADPDGFSVLCFGDLS